MTKKKPLHIVRKSRKAPPPPETPAKTTAREKYPPIALQSHPDAMLNPIERACKVLGDAGVGEKRGDLYLVDGKSVSLGTFLAAANDLITRKNAELPREKQAPLIGTNHHRWGQ